MRYGLPQKDLIYCRTSLQYYFDKISFVSVIYTLYSNAKVLLIFQITSKLSSLIKFNTINCFGRVDDSVCIPRDKNNTACTGK